MRFLLDRLLHTNKHFPQFQNLSLWVLWDGFSLLGSLPVAAQSCVSKLLIHPPEQSRDERISSETLLLKRMGIITPPPVISEQVSCHDVLEDMSKWKIRNVRTLITIFLHLTAFIFTLHGILEPDVSI